MWLPRRRDEVFPFFADASKLEALTPAWLKFEVLTPRPIPMQAGLRIDRVGSDLALVRLAQYAETVPAHSLLRHQRRHRDEAAALHGTVLSGVTGGEAAALILRQAGIRDVEIAGSSRKEPCIWSWSIPG